MARDFERECVETGGHWWYRPVKATRRINGREEVIYGPAQCQVCEAKKQQE